MGKRFVDEVTLISGRNTVRDFADMVGRCRLTPGVRSRPRARFQRLIPKYDESLSNFAFNCNLRHYVTAETEISHNIESRKNRVFIMLEVGRCSCSLTPG